MILKLFQPATSNWLLIAEELVDPAVWDRFLPCHTVGSDRWNFDATAKELAEPHLKLKLCPSYLKRGTSAFEYDWNAEENCILDHAMLVADVLGVELVFGAPKSPNKSAA